MHIHHYSSITGEYLGTDMARASPLEPGVFLIPANATAISPPAPGANQAALFADGAWSVVPDHRGERWYRPDGSAADITEPNIVPDASWTQTPPPPGAQQLRQAQVYAALAALDLTDRVAQRCFKAGVAYPPEWQAYTLALRAIVNGADTAGASLPPQPAYPAGT